MMGGQSSKNRKNTSSPPTPSAKSKFQADLSSYESACKHDPDLQSFDATLFRRTSRVINSLAAGAELHTLSFDSLREVTECLLDMNQDVVDYILKSKEDIWKNEGLSSLVKLYFESSIKTLDFCTALENSLKRAKRSQVIIQFAVNQFEAEVKAQEAVPGKKYVNTLAELNKFKEAGNPFTEEFFILFDLVYKQQLSMLQKLQEEKTKIGKKLKSVKTWKRLSNIVFVTAFVSVLIFSVVAAAIAAPPVVAALVGALTVPVGSVGKWCNSLWTRYEREIKGRQELIASMRMRTNIQIKDMENIGLLVNRLELEMESLMMKADFALKEEEMLTLAIEEIKKNLDVFMETIEVLTQHAARCSDSITKARTVISQRIITYCTKSTTEESNWMNMM